MKPVMRHRIHGLPLFIILSLGLAGEAFARQESSIKAWQVKQMNPWGYYTIHAGRNAIRFDGSTGGVLVSRAPSWQVIVFHRKEGRICKIPFEEWQNKVNVRARLSDSGQKPQSTIVAGVPAWKYTFAINDIQNSDSGTSTLYRSKLTKEHILRRTFTIARDESKLPYQEREIWRSFLELRSVGAIPLEICEELAGGKRSYQLETRSQKYVFVKPSLFDSPNGLKNSDSAISVFFGSQMEDMAEMMLE
jgi:hypothetical protein